MVMKLQTSCCSGQAPGTGPNARPAAAAVYWITGLSGSGKTTLARLLRQRLVDAGRAAWLADGDVLRSVFGSTYGFDADRRLEIAMTYGRLCREIAAQGIDVVCATISMFHAVQRWNRAQIPGYREIYLRVPLAELERRDAKGLYRRARAGEIANLVGLDIVAEEPERPDLVIDNFGAIGPSEALARLWAELVEGGRYPLCLGGLSR
jgi:adenylylsulfate kinase